MDWTKNVVFGRKTNDFWDSSHAFFPCSNLSSKVSWAWVSWWVVRVTPIWDSSVSKLLWPWLKIKTNFMHCYRIMIILIAQLPQCVLTVPHFTCFSSDPRGHENPFHTLTHQWLFTQQRAVSLDHTKSAGVPSNWRNVDVQFLPFLSASSIWFQMQRPRSPIIFHAIPCQELGHKCSPAAQDLRSWRIETSATGSNKGWPYVFEDAQTSLNDKTC